MENRTSTQEIVNETKKTSVKNENTNINQNKKICSVCKYENNASDKFCMSCGRIL